MILASTVLTILVMVVTGLVLFRRFARSPIIGGNLPPERDLLLLGILPGLALIGTLATCLAILNLLRLWIVLPMAAAIFCGFRSDANALWTGLRASIRRSLSSVRRGNLFPLIAVAAGMGFVLIGLRLSILPAENIDVWVFHIPLAQSFVAHHGFVFPQLDRMLFYSNQPLQFELLFATAMLAVPNYVAADAVNLAILSGLVLLVLSFARRARDMQFLVLCFLFICSQNFLLDAATPMIDLPRSCFSVSAYLFAYRYACDFRRLDLVLSALMAGSAVAGKYTELVTPLVIVVTLAPLMAGKRRTWPDMGVAIAVFTVVASYWYVKNAILFGNPIFPFLFGHPGLSDRWMTDYFQEMTRPFDPADRIYVTNLTTLRGWYDFAIVLFTHLRPLFPYAIIALFGAALPGRRRWILPFWCFVLFLFWYVVMFNAMRWVMSAMLLTLATSFIVWAQVADRIAEAWIPQWPTQMLEALARALRRHSDPWLTLSSLCFIVILLLGFVRLKQGSDFAITYLLPPGMNHDLAIAVTKPAGLESYLKRSRPGYALYRYIGEHNLAHVLQPFDNGGTEYASAYNGGHSNDWVLGYTILPADVAQTDAFALKNDIRYFVDREPIGPIDIERLGPSNVARAKAVVARLKTHARLIAKYDGGMSLYEILPANPPE